MNLKNLNALTDRIVARVLKRHGAKPPCCRGCFYCCKEPVYTTRAEVSAMLKGLSGEVYAKVGKQLASWARTFFAAPLSAEKEPSAVAYRALNLWCPFLINGECSAYENRPYACRLHIAKDTADGCRDDALRPQQKFILIPGLGEAIGLKAIKALLPGEAMTHDHLGVLLWEELTGVDCPTPARMVFRVDGETLIVEKYAED